jgi:hypothetical protein
VHRFLWRRKESGRSTYLLLSLFVQDAISTLNTVFLERAPKDSPPLRRSKRSGPGDMESSSPKKKRKWQDVSRTSLDADVAWSSMPSTLELPQEGDGSGPPDPDRLDSKRKRNARIVGGWIHPTFAQEIDRSWLERDVPKEIFDLRTYAPQVGDIVL